MKPKTLLPSLFAPLGALALPVLACAAHADAGVQGAALAPSGASAENDADRDDLVLRATSPPMMVDVKAGYAMVGTKTADLRSLLDGKFGHQVKMDLASQNPGERIRVEEFQIQSVEVSNRQYLEFVKTSGHNPPFGWGRDAIEEARMAHIEAEQARKKEAEAKGEPFEEQEFRPVDWWNNNWRKAEWAIPAGEEDFPVTFVSLRDAEAFCAWAGLRIPSEAEWIRAARGEGAQEYVQGKKFLSDKSLNIETSETKLRPISFTSESRTQAGIFDLPGSVYEWTTSPYAPLKGYKPMTYGPKKKQESIEPKFNANNRILKGGSYKGENPRFATRVAHRVAAPSYAVSDMIGFRVAHTPKFAVDHLESTMRNDVDTTMLNGGISTGRGIGEEAWMVEPSSGAPNLSNYSIIKSHVYAIFAPSSEVEQVTAAKLYSDSQKEPISLGILTLSEAMTEPALPAGTYVIKYRGAGKIREKKAKGGAVKVNEEDLRKAEEESKRKAEEAEKKRKTRLSKKEREKLEQEEAERKAAEEAAKVDLAKRKKEMEEKHAADVAAGRASSLQDKEEPESVLLAEDIPWDPEKENVFFYNVDTGAIVQKIEFTKSPFQFVKQSRKVVVRHEMENVAAVVTEKGVEKSPAARRFHIAIPTRASKTFVTFSLDFNARTSN